MAIGISELKAHDYLTRIPNSGVVVACVNSPSNVTLSGDMSDLDRMKTILDADNIFARKLKVETAYHSHHMTLVSDAYLRALQDVRTLPEANPDMQMFSSVKGHLVEAKDLGPQYWVDNMTSTVKFSQAIQSLIDYSTSKRKRIRDAKPFVDIIMELGPHAALQGPLKQILSVQDGKKANITYISLLNRGKNAIIASLDAIGHLFSYGYPVDILKANTPQIETITKPAVLVDLPSYPWNKSHRYWFESHLSVNYRFREYARHDLLGAPTPDSKPSEAQWRNFLRPSEIPWLEDHRVSAI